jgi:hypothetical protein
MRDTDDALIENTRIFCQIVAKSSSSSIYPSSSPEVQDTKLEWGSPCNLSELMGFLTYDIMGDVVFSTSFNMQTSEDNRFYMSISRDALHGLNTVRLPLEQPQRYCSHDNVSGWIHAAPAQAQTRSCLFQEIE